jgi:hypothetical protein
MAHSGSVFLVNLAGLELPAATLKAIERDINAAVDKHIGEVGKLKGNVASIPLGPETRGKWVIMKEFGGAFGG